MTKRLLPAAAVLLLAAAAVVLLWRGKDAPSPPPVRPAAPGATAEQGAGAEAVAATRPAPVSPLAADSDPEGGWRAAEFVQGRVVASESGVAVAEADVELFDFAAGRPLRTRTDAVGRFAFPETAGADHAFQLRIRAEGFALWTEEFSGGWALDVRLLPAARLAGIVVDAAGAPVAGARILAIGATHLEAGEIDYHAYLRRQALPEEYVAVGEAVTNGAGRYEFPALPEGRVVLVVRAPGRPPWLYGMKHVGRWEEIEIGPEGAEIRIELAPLGTILIQASDGTTGELLRQVRFRILAEIERFPFATSHPAVLRADGLYELPMWLAEGRILDGDVVAEQDGYAAARIGFSGQVDGSTVPVALSPAAAVAGTLFGLDGAPVAGAVVMAARGVSEALLASAVTDAAGGFRLSGLLSREVVTLSCFDPSFERVIAVVALTLVPGETRTIVIGGPERACLHGRVAMDGRPVHNALLALEGEETSLRIFTGRDGVYRLDGLAPGRYRLFANLSQEDELVFLTQYIELAAGERRRADFEADFVATGVVVDAETGEPLEDEIAVLARPAGEPEAPPVAETAALMGSFVLRLPGPGVYLLTAMDDFHTPSPVRVDLEREPRVEGVRIAMVPERHEGRIALQVVDAETGAPIGEGNYEYQAGNSNLWGYYEGGAVLDEELELGDYRYEVSADGYATERLTIRLDAATRSVERTVRLFRTDSAWVVEVEAGSNAARAGLQAGDVIVEYDGEPVRSAGDLTELVLETEPEDEVGLRILREGRELRITAAGGRLGIRIEDHRAAR